MDRHEKNHKSSKRSRSERDDHKHRSHDRDSDSYYSQNHQKSEKESARDRDSRRNHHRSKNSSSKGEDRNREDSGDMERSSESFRKSQERFLEDREDDVRDGVSGHDSEFEGRKKRKDRDLDDIERDSEVSNDARANCEREKKRERRRFGEKVKAEEVENNETDLLLSSVNDFSNGNGTYHEHVRPANGASIESSFNSSGIVPDSSFQLQPTKVSSISNKNENKGVSVTRSHEVPGNSSTDGASSTTGKSGSLSLDALAKAKKALQMQKELSEKLKKLPQLNKGTGSEEGSKAKSSATVTTPAMSNFSVSSVGVSTIPSTPGLSSMKNYEVVKRAQELAAKMGFRQDPQFAPLINLFPGQMPPEISIPQKPNKAPVLRVDALGREIDEHGNVINVTKPSNLSTLKVNINKQKKESYQILKPEIDMNPESNPFFDLRMGVNKTKILRPKRSTFQFVEEGKWSKEAEIMKIKNQFGEEQVRDLRARKALHARAKVAPDINPNFIEISERVVSKEKLKDPIPEIEWWDAPLLLSGKYDGADDGSLMDHVRVEKMTIYVEHPRPIEPPAEPAPPPPQPLKLTKKEQKKLRTQRRLAREKDRQEMIRQGLLEPPKPKVKMSNLMKVLGSEATQDPTRLEMEIRTAAAEREQAHIDRNIARKLTPAERRDKKEKKLFDDSRTFETIVSVYKVNILTDKKTRFKVDVNAHENRLSGCCVISDGVTVIVVEGGSKSIKRYGKLMLKRINWADAANDEDDLGERDEKPVNRCSLVWQGSVAKPAFHKFYIHECLTQAAARKIFVDSGVAHYWDLAVNFTDDASLS